ncbi:MAG TPA: cytochrome c [Anaerolineae bacterium]|nr:cytochrome c [Anaerolineae bacterium]
MNPLWRSLFFPAVMLVGLLLSGFVIVSSLQAATSPELQKLAALTYQKNTGQLAAQGRALFIAKGCMVCHRHDSVATLRASAQMFDMDDVPNLSRLKIDSDYLRRWLRDPQGIKPNTAMPNLHLSDDEIEMLVAFLTSTRQ